MQTLPIETTVSKTRKIDLPIPFFARRKDDKKYIALLDENTVVTFYTCKGLTTISNATPDSHEKRELVEAWEGEEWTACTETEFLDKYDAVIESISLHPKLAV